MLTIHSRRKEKKTALNSREKTCGKADENRREPWVKNQEPVFVPKVTVRLFISSYRKAPKDNSQQLRTARDTIRDECKDLLAAAASLFIRCDARNC